MATMLRSLKYARRLSAGAAARRLGAPATLLNRAPSTTTAKTTTTTFLARSSVGCLHQDRNYVTNAAVKREYSGQINIDEMLRDLDTKSRNIGSIYKYDVERILEATMDKRSMTSTQALLLIRCCGMFLQRESPKSREALLKKILETAKVLNVTLDISHYNALLQVNLENEVDFSPLEFLMELKQNNIIPNRVTFQRLIEQYCTKGDIAGATKILEHMSQHDIPLNENIFSSLMIGHSMTNDVPSALKILDIMKQASVEATSRTYTSLLCVHAKSGDIEAIRSVLKECKDKDIIISDKELLDVIYTLAINKHSEYLDEVMSYINKSVTYNKNAIRVICKLLEKRESDVAFKIQKSFVKLSNSSEDLKFLDGVLFIKKLISSDYDAQEIIKYCNLLVNNEMNTLAYETALFHVYYENKHDYALPLLKAMKKLDREIREYYFYPLFVSYGKTNNLQGILSTMKSMIFDFEVMPMILTIKDYIVPYINEDPFTTVRTLVDNNLSYTNACNAVLIHLLEENKLNQALKLLLTTNIFCKINLIEKPLLHAFLNTKDVNSLVNIFQVLLQMTNKNLEENNISENSKANSELYSPTDFVNDVTISIIKQLPNYDLATVKSILQNLLKKGINIKQTTANFIKTHLGENITPEISEILIKLTSEDLKLELVKRDRPRLFFTGNLEKKAEKSLDFKFLYVQEQAKLKNHDVVEKLVKELEEINPTYPIGFCASLLNYYSMIDNMEAADKWYKRVLETDPECQIDKAKLVNYANVLVKNNRASDALKVLDHKTVDKKENREDIYERLLNSASTYCPDNVEDFFIKLKDNNYFKQPTNRLLAPIIRAHLNSGNIKKALEKFEWFCENYKLTPNKSGLMMTLIRNEDADSLQHLTDLCTRIYGESNALFDLAISFFECDKPRQARKILETPGLRVKEDRISHVGQRFVVQKKTIALEKFTELLNGLQYDINPLYSMLLDLYEEENDWQKSLALWTQMQEDNIQPSITFMKKLESILKNNNQNVPFTVTKEKDVDDYSQNFHNALENQNFDECKRVLQNIPDSVKSNYLLQLIDAFVNQDNLTEALKSLSEFFTINQKFAPQIEDTVKNILNKLVNSNDFENISQVVLDLQQHYKKLKNNRKNRSTKQTFRKTASNYTLNQIFYDLGKYEDFINFLESKIASKDTAEKYMSLFHVNTAVKAISQSPTIEEKLKSFSSKLSEYDIWSPSTAIWIHKFINNSPDAENFFKENVKKFFYSNSAIFACIENGALEKIPEIADKITNENNGLNFDQKRSSSVSFLTIITNNEIPNKYDLAFECLRRINKTVPLQTINSNVIKKIEENVSDKGAFEALRTENTRNQEKATG